MSGRVAVYIYIYIYIYAPATICSYDQSIIVLKNVEESGRGEYNILFYYFAWII